MNYVGPGKDATHVAVSPASGTFTTAANLILTATAFDIANAPLPGTPMEWTVNDAAMGAFTAGGVFAPSGKSGPVTLTATTPTGISGSTTVDLAAPQPGALIVISGDGQIGTVQSALPAPFVVKVVDQFGTIMNGVTVTWTRLTGGGSLASSTSTTNASGLASAQYTLGSAPGEETIRASVSGLATSVTFTANAVTGIPTAITIVSGSAQTDTVGKALPGPFVAIVVDAQGNPVAGATVTWTRTAGAGSPANSTSTTSALGLTSVQYTLGTAAGAETVQATVTGVASPAVFTATALAGKPTVIAIVAGDGQADTIFKTLSAPFTVKVTDAYGNAVSGATVTWTRTAGFGTPANSTSTTSVTGVATLSYRLGDIAGTETVVASVAGVGTSVTFTATAADIPPEDLGLPIVTGFAYLRVQPSPVSPRVGDTLTFTVDSIDAAGHATSVTAQWASSNPGRGSINASGRLIVADTGAIIITATRNGLVGHARVGVLPAPTLTGFSFAPKTLTGITNAALTTSFTFSATDAGTGVTSATVTLTAPGGTTKTCTFGAPSTGSARNGSFDCALTIPAGSPAGVWHVTSLVLNGSVTRTYGESVLALFSPTTLTINP